MAIPFAPTPWPHRVMATPAPPQKPLGDIFSVESTDIEFSNPNFLGELQKGGI